MICEKEIREKSLENIAEKMLIASRTAPKARGVDNLVLGYLNKNEIVKISEEMIRLTTVEGMPEHFKRDGKNILKAEIIVLIGTKLQPLGVNCKLCGFESCRAKKEEVPCVFNTNDLGIAIGSAVSVAMDFRVDNRVMFSIGVAVKNLKLIDKDVKILFGIPLSASGKNIFFDRG